MNKSLLKTQNYNQKQISRFSKAVLLLLLWCAAPGMSTQAQQPYFNERPEFLKANSIWAFGDSAGLDFNSGAPASIVTAMHNKVSGSEGFASVSDPVSGKLLFYSNGGICWNATHQVMPNGDSLFGNGTTETNGFGLGGYSTTQGVCIVPFIDTPGKYYLFSLMGATNTSMSTTSGKNGILFYSVVDMHLNNGLGDIEAGRKNIVLDYDLLSEGMIAVPGNNCDIWLIVHTQNKPEFKAYHITNNGVNNTPILSNTGDVLMGPGAYGYAYMAVSPDRPKIAISNFPAPLNFVNSSTGNGVLITEFNPSTGVLSNAINIFDYTPFYPLYPNGPGSLTPTSLCFSPDNSRLYIKASYPTNNLGVTTTGLFQFDVSVYDSAFITASRTLITNSPGYVLRRYKDVIYWDIYQKDKTQPSYLHRINKPNLIGTACDFEASAIRLQPRTNALNGLGNDVVYPLPVDTIRQLVFDTIACLKQGVSLSATLSSANNEYVWDNGTTGSIRQVTEPGTYWVTYNETFCQVRTDSFVVKGASLSPVITVNVYELGTTEPYTTYQWLFNGKVIPGATQRTYTVSENGDYQIVVTSEGGCIDTSAPYKVTNVDNSNHIENTDVRATQIKVYPNPAHDLVHISAPCSVNIVLTSIEGRVIRQLSNVTTLPLKGLVPGMYLLCISDQNQNVLKLDKLTVF